jgi:hypothetical protein
LFLCFTLLDIRISSCKEFCLWLYKKKTVPRASARSVGQYRFLLCLISSTTRDMRHVQSGEFSSIWLGYCLLEAFNMSHQTTRWKAK